MRILMVLTYYRPHISGLTNCVELLARTLVRKGHHVTVLTSQHESDLLRFEVIEGVHVVRTPVMIRMGKGVVMPSLMAQAWRLMGEHDIVHLHLPQLDAGPIALLARMKRRPVAVSYYCDLHLPKGVVNRLANLSIHAMSYLAGTLAQHVSAGTQDFIDHSPFLQRMGAKVQEILLPVNTLPVDQTEVTDFRRRHLSDGCNPVIGMATRFASEKGIEVLLDALPRVLSAYPSATVLFTGQHEGVWGEQAYRDKLTPAIELLQAQGRWKFLGILEPQQLAAYYASLDVLVVPSLNRTESFGLVQVEAMMHGTPSISSNLPGVRQPVEMTKMGLVVPVADAESLANAILEVVGNQANYQGDPAMVASQFSADRNAAAYEEVYAQLLDMPIDKQNWVVQETPIPERRAA